MEQFKVSIIIPAYNAAEYISATIGSIKEQTYDNWELIIVENGSTDSTRDVLRQIDDKRIIVSLNDENLGAARSRNIGIDMASGRFIAFIDADDIWKSDKLEKQVAYMLKEDIAFSFTGYEFGDDKAEPTGKIVCVPKTLSYNEALKNTTIFTSTVMFDMNKLKKEDIQMPCVKSEDTATWWRILRSGYTAYGINDNLCIYRRPAKSLSSNKLEAVRRIWNLYRRVEGLSIVKSVICFVGWGFRAVKRRV